MIYELHFKVMEVKQILSASCITSCFIWFVRYGKKYIIALHNGVVFVPLTASVCVTKITKRNKQKVTNKKFSIRIYRRVKMIKISGADEILRPPVLN